MRIQMLFDNFLFWKLNLSRCPMKLFLTNCKFNVLFITNHHIQYKTSFYGIHLFRAWFKTTANHCILNESEVLHLANKQGPLLTFFILCLSKLDHFSQIWVNLLSHLFLGVFTPVFTDNECTPFLKFISWKCT